MFENGVLRKISKAKMRKSLVFDEKRRNRSKNMRQKKYKNVNKT